MLSCCCIPLYMLYIYRYIKGIVIPFFNPGNIVEIPLLIPTLHFHSS